MQCNESNSNTSDTEVGSKVRTYHLAWDTAFYFSLNDAQMLNQFDHIKRRPGKLYQHQDGRKGIAYNNDQSEQFSKDNKVIVRFFINNEIINGLSEEKRSVHISKLKLIGLID